jgi:hypothetical protein
MQIHQILLIFIKIYKILLNFIYPLFSFIREIDLIE